MNCQNVIQNNLRLPFQSAQIEVILFGRHWGTASSTQRTSNVLRAYSECGSDLPLEGPRSPGARAQCVLVDSTNLRCFVKDLWQVELIVPISLETRHRLSDRKQNILSTCLDASMWHRVAEELTLPTPTPRFLGMCFPSPAPPPGITGSSEASTKISHTELSCLMPGSLCGTTILFPLQ